MKSDMELPQSKLWLENNECKWTIALEGLTNEEIKIVNDSLVAKVYSSRSLIYCYGDNPSSLLIVESGKIKMYHSRPSGEMFTIAIWPAGYTVGLLSTLLNKKRLATVESVGMTTILELPRSDLLNLMRQLPNFSINIARLAASLANEVMHMASALTLDPAVSRLSNVLMRVAVPENKSSFRKSAVVRGLSQDDLASMVGVSRTWLTLILSRLERNGLIWRKRLEIGIYDLDAFDQFCKKLDRDS